jgi:hypothetical protein
MTICRRRTAPYDINIVTIVHSGMYEDCDNANRIDRRPASMRTTKRVVEARIAQYTQSVATIRPNSWAGSNIAVVSRGSFELNSVVDSFITHSGNVSRDAQLIARAAGRKRDCDFNAEMPLDVTDALPYITARLAQTHSKQYNVLCHLNETVVPASDTSCSVTGSVTTKSR